MDTYLALNPLAATAGHVVTVQEKINRLNVVKEESWIQLLTSASRLYRAGDIGADELLAMGLEMRDSFGLGFTRVWNAHAPIRYGKLRSIVDRQKRDAPNGPLGSWAGTFPLFDQPRPPYGVSVVYVLFDETNNPCYVGSTETFRSRMVEHRSQKPGLRSWAAYPCRDREHAYQLEVDLLHQHKPRMNKRRGR